MVYFFYGDNTFAAKSKIRELIERYRSAVDNPDFGLYRFDSDSDPSEVVTALTSQPMFADSSLVVIENASDNSRLRDAILDNAGRIPEKTVAVIYEEHIDKRSRWYKYLSEHANTKEFSEKSERQLLQWIESQARHRELDIGKGTARFLLDWAGGDQWRLDKELDKLKGVDRANEDTIRQLISPSPKRTIFELLDAMGTGKTQQAIECFDDLRAQNIHELEILTMISWQVRNLIIVASESGMSDREIASKHKMNPYVVSKSRKITRRMRFDALVNVYKTVIALDYQMKTTHHIEPRTLLEQAVVDIGELSKV